MLFLWISMMPKRGLEAMCGSGNLRSALKLNYQRLTGYAATQRKAHRKVLVNRAVQKRKHLSRDKHTNSWRTCSLRRRTAPAHWVFVWPRNLQKQRYLLLQLRLRWHGNSDLQTDIESDASAGSPYKLKAGAGGCALSCRPGAHRSGDLLFHGLQWLSDNPSRCHQLNKSQASRDYLIR